MMDLKPFELLDDLEPLGKANAVLLKWDGSRYVKSQNKIELHDICSTHGDRGDRGYCFLSSMSNLWETVSGLYQQAPARIY